MNGFHESVEEVSKCMKKEVGRLLILSLPLKSCKALVRFCPILSFLTAMWRVKLSLIVGKVRLRFSMTSEAGQCQLDTLQCSLSHYSDI